MEDQQWEVVGQGDGGVEEGSVRLTDTMVISLNAEPLDT